MFYYLHLLQNSHETLGMLRVFEYITFRTAYASLTALLISLLFGKQLITTLQQFQIGQQIREEGPRSHQAKRGTPTMGGVLILIGIGISTLLWFDWSNRFVWVVMAVTIGFGAIGFMDDFDKVTKRSHKGISGRTRLLIEFFVAGLACTWVASRTGTTLYLPFLKDVGLNIGFFYIAFAAFIVTGFGNAVNLTDGLDGLATMPVVIAAAAFAIIAYLVGNIRFSDYLGVHHVPGSGELAVFAAALIGACLGFLWYNAPPAAVFMGDTGSLALGGALGAVAVATHHEFVLVIIGGLFVLEAVSVIVQVFWFKRFGKRVFRMAPIHHHFEHLGWSEPTVVIRFWIISFILALAGLSTLKLR